MMTLLKEMSTATPRAYQEWLDHVTARYADVPSVNNCRIGLETERLFRARAAGEITVEYFQDRIAQAEGALLVWPEASVLDDQSCFMTPPEPL